MGGFISCPELLTPIPDYELNIMRLYLIGILRTTTPDELLYLAVDDDEIYEVCRMNEELRQNCIIAAVRKYHREKLLYEDVHNRTADFMELLDDFSCVQDEEDRQREQTFLSALRRFCRRVRAATYSAVHTRRGEARRYSPKTAESRV